MCTVQHDNLNLFLVLNTFQKDKRKIKKARGSPMGGKPNETVCMNKTIDESLFSKKLARGFPMGGKPNETVCMNKNIDKSYLIHKQTVTYVTLVARP